MKSVEIYLRDEVAPNRAGQVVPFLNGLHHTPLRLLCGGTQHVVDDVEDCGNRNTR